MWLEALLAQEDLVQLMKQFLPVRIYLHHEEEGKTDRWLSLETATEVALVANEGLEITCPAELVWEIAGLKPSVKVDVLRVMIRPKINALHKGHTLEFHLQVEEADFHSFPAFMDGTVVKAVNAILANKTISWNFTETLARTVPLGKMFDPVEALDVRVNWGKVRIQTSALALAISFKIDIVRGD